MPAVFLVGLILAQTASADTADSGQLERVRKALARAPALETVRKPDTDRPVFRLQVRAPDWGPPPWDDRTSVPPYVRPSFPIYHYEFLAQVTPEALRASTLYPGADMMPLFKSLAKSIDQERKRRQERAAKEEVRRSLEALARASAPSIK